MTSPAPTTLLKAASLLAGVAIAIAGSPTPAHAHASQWTQLTDHGSALDEVGVARAPDGTLHVAALEHPTGPTTSLVYRTIDAQGQLSATDTIAAGWANMTGPEMLDNPEGLAIVFAGQRSTDPNDPYREGRALEALLVNGTWQLTPPITALPGPAYAADRVAATFDPSGALVTAWGTADGLQTHVGADMTFPNASLQAGCCAYGAAVGAGPTTAWYSNQTGAEGIKVHTPAGQTLTAPGSKAPLDEKVGLSSDGTRVAYPSGKRLVVWPAGATAPTLKRTAPGAAHVELADGPAGRLWVLWAQGRTLKAARTNPQRTVLGATVGVKSKQPIDALNGDGSLGPLQAIATRGTTGAALATVKPGLTLTKTKHGYQATDAGDPVKATITKTKHTVTATKAGYTKATVKR
jgi:hypothetical protein